MSGKFVLKSSKGGKFRFNLRAGNGQIVLTSEAYSTKTAALNGIKSLGKNCTTEKCIERKVAKNGKPYFNLKATNGQVIGKSQMYASTAAMEKGIRSVQNNGGSQVDDQTCTARTDLRGVPEEIAHEPELVRSWRAAEADSNDSAVLERVEAALRRINTSPSQATMTKSEFLASTEHSVA